MKLSRKRVNLHGKEKRTALMFIALPLIGFCIFTLISLVAVMVLSFSDFNIHKNQYTFDEPLRNYTDLFTNPTYSTAFFNSIWNTLFLLLGIPLGMIVGVFLAALLQSKAVKKGNKIFQVLFYLPAVTSAVAVNLVFRYIFDPSYGIINTLLNVDLAWFNNEWLIKIAIILKKHLVQHGQYDDTVSRRHVGYPRQLLRVRQRRRRDCDAEVFPHNSASIDAYDVLYPHHGYYRRSAILCRRTSLRCGCYRVADDSLLHMAIRHQSGQAGTRQCGVSDTGGVHNDNHYHTVPFFG